MASKPVHEDRLDSLQDRLDQDGRTSPALQRAVSKTEERISRAIDEEMKARQGRRHKVKVVVDAQT